MAFKLKELEGQLGEIIAGITAPKPMVLWKERYHAYQVWLEPDYLNIAELKVNIYSGEFCRYSVNDGVFEPDYDVYYFFQQNTGRLLYSEYGSNLEVTLTNFIREIGKKVDSVEDLLCTYIFDNGEFLRKKVLTREKL